MKAAFYEKMGPAAEVLELAEIAPPVPGEGDVRIKVAYSGVNPSDVKNRAGLVFPELPFPRIIPHQDGSGVIDQVGEGVSESRIGERVWTWNAQFGRPFGTAAEYITLPSVQAPRLPDATDLAFGACLGCPALTGYRAATLGEPVAGRTVLVSGGSGGVGHYAVQFSKLKGARVIATVSSEEKAQHVRMGGADEVINYVDEDVPARIAELTNGKGVDRIIEVEFGAHLPELTSILAREGTIYVYGSFLNMTPEINVQQLMLHGATMHFRSVYFLPLDVRLAAIDDITAILERGELINPIGAQFPLSEIIAAHEAVEQRKFIGNVVVSI